MNLYFSINPDPVKFLNGYLIIYWLITLAGLFMIGAGIYYHWRYKFSYRNCLVGFIGIIFIILAYHFSWSYFYVLSFKNQKITLRYFFPQRSKVFSIHDIKSMTRKPFGRYTLYHFLIETRDGRVYSSAAMKAKNVDFNEVKFKQYLQQQLGYSRSKSK